jgi:hypothetical protein
LSGAVTAQVPSTPKNNPMMIHPVVDTDRMESLGPSTF